MNTPLVVADEPGAWENNGGELLHDAVQTAQGKPGSPLRAVYIGTPFAYGERGVTGGTRSQRVSTDRPRPRMYVCKATPRSWDSWKEIMRVNPLARISPELREKLKIERMEARNDIRLKARFLSYRLNVPSGDESTVLLDAAQWRRALARDVPPRRGRPIVGIDLGHGRAWTTAVCLHLNGRTEALAISPGVPSIEVQEKKRSRPSGPIPITGFIWTSSCCRGSSCSPPAHVVGYDHFEEWGVPAHMVCDRFKLDELRDAVGGHVPIEPRVTQWSASHGRYPFSSQIGGGWADSLSRKIAGNLLTASLAASQQRRRIKAATSG